MTKHEYYQYLKSDKWGVKRNLILELDNYECKICSCTDLLDVHHLTYDNIGNESECDLVTLCRNCHSRVSHYHKIEGLSLDQALDLIAKRHNKTSYQLKDYANHRREIKLVYRKEQIRRREKNRLRIYEPIEMPANFIPDNIKRVLVEADIDLESVFKRC